MHSDNPDQRSFAEPSSSGIFPSYTKDQLIQMQKEDPELKFVWERWSQNWAPGDEYFKHPSEPDNVKSWLTHWSRLSLKDGLLVRRVLEPVFGEIFQVLLPQCLRKNVLVGCLFG